MAASGIWTNRAENAGVPLPPDSRAPTSQVLGDRSSPSRSSPSRSSSSRSSPSRSQAATPASLPARSPQTRSPQARSNHQARLPDLPSPESTVILPGWLPHWGNQARATPTPSSRFAYDVPAHREVVVDLSDRRLTLRINQRTITSYPVAIGKAGWETPIGHYQVERRQRDPEWEHPLTKRIFPSGPDNPLGAAWIGFRSESGFHFGFHGTYDEFLLGEAVSHGCVRMANADILDLFDQVELGTDITVKP
jgi:L,D-transpeptidase ErfK/SrfK